MVGRGLIWSLCVKTASPSRVLDFEDWVGIEADRDRRPLG